MKRLALAFTTILPAVALAAPVASDPQVNEIKVEANASTGQERICIRVYQFQDQSFKCSKPFAKGNPLVAKIFDLHKKAKLKLPFDSRLNVSDYTIEDLDAAIAASATAAAPAEPAATDKVCQVDSSELLQEMLFKDSGEAYIARSMHFTNLRLPGSTNVNASVKLPYSENTDTTSLYVKTANYKLDSTKTISITAEAPKTKFQGEFLPASLKVAITNDSDGKPVSSYVCKVQVNKATSQGDLTPAASGVQ
jgi:hypothetical protein